MTGKVIISIFDSIPLWIMILPIGICSVVALAIFIERVIFYRTIDTDYRVLMNSLIEKIKSNSINDAKLVCSGYKSQVIIKSIYNILDEWNNISDKEVVIRDESHKAIRAIEKFGGVISTIATISPMLGLLGTVTGMMKSFSGLAKLGPSAQDLLARGITEALITTALGLMVAIPSMMFYNYMVSKVDFFMREIEFIANSFAEAGKNSSN